ncbi:PD-(D/E)XK nuclease family protein [Actinocrispum wychmicini]|uniref:PD-(D/E)XK nuclease superfamily protein n=1 Tax=Actinocrispum wychmicini TaxID=1213861 RepID=A0A4R2JSN6_9PSEU|nr:PD-(D/E)XK nuclease family protein [Actinocrispum wychmicini]TCO57185.1 PD-(D/E)XK nuclease superfamily protein [Actinocrispum wychmicini]
MTTIERRPAHQPAAVTPAPATVDYSTAQLLLEWDRRRPRSLQTELGMSEVGGCRRRAGYRIAGVAPTNPGGSVQAVMGTAVHDAVEDVFRDLQANGLIPHEDLVEYEVRFAGILGHLDRYEALRERVRDTKTTSQRWLDHIIIHGPDLPHMWQTHLYGAALIQLGYPVREIVIDYLARDTGNDHQVTMQFDIRHVRDALAWLQAVRETDLEFLARDYAPESPFCQHCPFLTVCWAGGVPDRDPRSVLYVEDPDAATWAAKLDQARADKKDAEAREKEAKGALDALRPNVTGRSDPVDVGYDKCLVWTVKTQRGLDSGQVRAEYAATGARPPIKESTSVELKLTAKPDTGDAP